MYTGVTITPDFVKQEVAKGKPFTIGFLNAGPNYNMQGEERQKLHMAHLMHLFTLKQQGKVLLVGPVSDNPVTKGIVIYSTPDKEEAEKCMDADPAVIAGIFVYEIFGWFGIPGDGI